MAVDGEGDLYIFIIINPDDGLPPLLVLFKVDGETGYILIDCREIVVPETGVNCPQIMSTPNGDSLYLIWIEDDSEGWSKYIMFAVIDTNGDFIVEPYAAYDYTDEDPEELQNLACAVNEVGDVFAAWSDGDPEVSGYWSVLGWFDHAFLGIEDETGPIVDTSDLSLSCSLNPFRESVTIAIEGTAIPDQLAVYDLSGRIVRTLFRNGGTTFLWDGCDSIGDELPAGTYIIEGASAGRLASVTVVKL